jgi:hypothetical protein
MDETKFDKHLNIRSKSAVYLHMRRHGHNGSRGYRTHTNQPVMRVDFDEDFVRAIDARWRHTLQMARVEEKVCEHTG